MSDVFSDASQALGVPAWAIPICAGILAIATLADKSMKPEAKAEIGEFLDHGELSTATPTITNIVWTAFVATFGERQFSWRCLYRTVLLSTFAVYSIILLVWSKHGSEIQAHDPNPASMPKMIAGSFEGVLILGLILNWVSVGKTRLILIGMRRLQGVAALLCFMLLDVLLTYALLMLLYWGPRLSVYGRADLCSTMHYYWPADCSSLGRVTGVLAGIVGVTDSMLTRLWSQAGLLTAGNLFNLAVGLGALLTSIWTVLIVAAIAFLRLLSPVAQARRLVRWGWDLQASPVSAIGWIMAVLVWVGALVYRIV